MSATQDIDGPYWRWDGDDLLLDCHLQPRASRDEFAGLQGARLKIRLCAPPVDGKANAQLLVLLAKAFGVARRDVEIESGESSRLKRVRIRHPPCLPSHLGITAR